MKTNYFFISRMIRVYVGAFFGLIFILGLFIVPAVAMGGFSGLSIYLPLGFSEESLIIAAFVWFPFLIITILGIVIGRQVVSETKKDPNLVSNPSFTILVHGLVIPILMTILLFFLYLKFINLFQTRDIGFMDIFFLN